MPFSKHGMVTRRRFLSAAALAAGAAAAGALSPERGRASAAGRPLKRVELLANYSFNGRHAPFFVGVDKGFYRDAGFDVRVTPTTGSGFVVAAVESGHGDFGMADATTLVRAVSKGAAIKAFTVYMDVSTSGLASLQPYPTVQSIMSRTIVSSPTDSVRVVLPLILQSRGIDPASIKWLNADPSTWFALMAGGKADLMGASSDGDMPILTKLAAQQGKSAYFTLFADWGYDALGYVLVAKTSRIQSDPAELRAFADATGRAVKWSLANPEETARIMVRYNPVMNYDTTLAQWRGAMVAINTPYVKLHGYGFATPDRLNRTLELVDKVLKLDKPLTPADVYDRALGR
ncbi:MAG TPA: ABC transporter substrate-binding protein [bacterium]|nr:ABC transporter substrate-binding protein [bacterium]